MTALQQEAVVSTDPLRAARLAAYEAYLDASAYDERGRVDATVDAVLHTLNDHGVLDVPDLVPTPEKLDEYALWLAERSERYVFMEGEGWRRLRRSRVDIRMAYGKAVDLLVPGQEYLARDLERVKQILLDNVDGGAS